MLAFHWELWFANGKEKQRRQIEMIRPDFLMVSRYLIYVERGARVIFKICTVISRLIFIEESVCIMILAHCGSFNLRHLMLVKQSHEKYAMTRHEQPASFSNLMHNLWFWQYSIGFSCPNMMDNKSVNILMFAQFDFMFSSKFEFCIEWEKLFGISRTYLCAKCDNQPSFN